MKLKSKDIAKQLGVSPATVSLVLNNKPGISEETRNRIIQYLEENGYHTAKLHASRSGVQNTIQFVVYKKHGKVVSDTPFFSDLIESIHHSARSAGYNLHLIYIDEKKDDIFSILSMIKQSHTSSLLILATEMYAQDIAPFRQLNIPILLLDSQFESQDLNTVCINNSDGLYKAVQYLSDLGHKEIGYLHSNVWIYNFEQRMLRLRQHAAEKGIFLKEENLFSLEPTVEGAYKDMKHLLAKKKNVPPALFADNDIIAFGAIRALKEEGFSIPADVSIIGFDDTPFCELLDPKLTTIRVFKDQMGTIAVKRLLESMEDPDACTQKTYIGTELIIRESTAKPLFT